MAWSAARNRARRRKYISASELAKMGVCEQKLVFEKELGERRTPDQERSVREGIERHEKFFREAFIVNPNADTSERNPWCFVASALYGKDAAETIALRAIRDQLLRPHPMGRGLIRIYYRISPRLAAWTAKRKWLARFARFVLKPVIRFVAYLSREHHER
jgi:hypothetical protein